MKHKIRAALNEIEQEKNVTILSAKDFGSTAWNLDSEESDRDIAFIFIQNPEEYFKLGTYTENIDRDIEIDGQEHTFMGWNIKRFIELLDNSNPTTIEFLNSPITYYELSTDYLDIRFEDVEEEETRQKMLETLNWFPVETLRDHANKNFKPISLFYHYRSMAKDNFEKYIENRNDITVKRHLYILRGLCYARYVEETHEMPPLDFPEFFENELDNIKGGFMPDWIYRQLGEFIRLKKQGKGSRQHGDEELWDWMRQELDNKLDHEKHNIRGTDTETLNKIMEEMI